MLGERVARARAKKGLTQEQLAQSAGLRQGHISRIESGDIKNVRGDILVKMAQALGVTTDYLLGLGDGEQEKRPRRRATKAG